MSWKNINRQHLEQYIPDQEVRIERIISFAFMGMITFMTIIVFGLYFKNPGNTAPDLTPDHTLHLILVLVLFVFFVGSQIFSRIVIRNLWKESELNTQINALSVKEPTEKQVVGFLSEKLRVSHIISLAVLEGAAMMGLVFLFIPITENGTIPLWSWFNLIPVVYFYLASASMLPNKEKMVNQLEWRLRQFNGN